MKRIMFILMSSLLLIGCSAHAKAENIEKMVIEPYNLNENEKHLLNGVGINDYDTLIYTISGKVPVGTEFQIKVDYYENGKKKEEHINLKMKPGEETEFLDSELLVVSKREENQKIMWSASFLGGLNTGEFTEEMKDNGEAESSLKEKKIVKKGKPIVLGVYTRAMNGNKLSGVNLESSIEEIVKNREGAFVVLLEVN